MKTFASILTTTAVAASVLITGGGSATESVAGATARDGAHDVANSGSVVAVAESDKAQEFCDALATGEDRAYVPKPMRGRIFLPETRARNHPLRCGDGRNHGAVHIEMKHNVANWDVADRCIDAIFWGSDPEPEGAVFRRKLNWHGGWALAVYGRDLITAYPKDSTRSGWRTCSRK